jgi:subtilisin family serine protease
MRKQAHLFQESRLSRIVLWSIVWLGSSSAILGQNSRSTEENLTPAQRKIDPLVRNMIDRLRVEGADRSNAANVKVAQLFSTSFVRVDNRARIQVYIEVTEVNPTRLTALRPVPEVEVEFTNEKLKVVQAWVPHTQVETIAALDFVIRVRPPDYATFRTGSVTSQGDTILKTDLVRNTLGLTGAGVKVGVISDGANNVAASQATGDLAAPITIFGTCDPAVTHTTCNEGTAMMEIVHDLAPGAVLAMGDAFTTLSFIQRVTDLTNWGAKVIVDDVGFYGEPYFEDGGVANSYASALAQGVVLVSAAGNDAQSHYQGVYLNSGGYHDFGGGDVTMSFTQPPGPATIVLQWSNRFAHSADDYDFCVTDPSGTLVMGCSQNLQSGTQNPVEAVTVVCPGPSDCTSAARISLFSGAPQTLELFFLGAIATEHVVADDSVFGHAAVPGVISVGAIASTNPGNLTIEGYSSRGPSTVFFPAFQQRSSPTLTAIDCVSVTGAGGFPSNFCGTSAAAPHIAAIAALLLQANPSLTPAQVSSRLQATAADRGGLGVDTTYGSGLADALAAAGGSAKKVRGQLTSTD